MINYIVACYMGPRRQINVNPLVYIKNHIKWLKTSKNIDNVIFVFNDASFIKNNEQAIAIQLVKDAGYNYIRRTNEGFSYAAWQEGIKNIIKDDRYNYSFLTEDDYIPSTPDIINRYLESMDGETGFVASYYQNDIIGINGLINIPQHAGIANGLISHKAVKDVISKGKNPFDLHLKEVIVTPSEKHYPVAIYNQYNYLKNIIQAGYKMKDITKNYNTIFYSTEGSHIGIHYYGNLDGICLMEPNFTILNSKDFSDIHYKSKM